jgi:ribose transport system substrate-binding protein
MNKKLLRLLGVLLICTLIVSGCDKGAGDLVAAKELLNDAESKIDYSSIDGMNLPPGTKIAFVTKDSGKSYWKAVQTGAQRAVDDLNEALGYEGEDKVKIVFTSPSSELEVEEQINLVDGILAENPSVLCLAAIDFQSLQAQFELARENQIPVIAVDSGVSNQLEESICATDNVAAGREAAVKMADLMEEEGEVAVLSHYAKTQSSIERVLGFTQEIEENYPYIHITEVDYQEDDESLADTALETLEANPRIKAYFGTNEDAALGIISACEEMNREDIIIVGFDSGNKQIKAVKDGTESGIISQNPYGMGYASVVAGARAVLKMGNDKFIDTGFRWISKENIEIEEIQKYLYE